MGALADLELEDQLLHLMKGGGKKPPPSSASATRVPSQLVMVRTLYQLWGGTALVLPCVCRKGTGSIPMLPPLERLWLWVLCTSRQITGMRYEGVVTWGGVTWGAIAWGGVTWGGVGVAWGWGHLGEVTWGVALRLLCRG